MDAEIINTDVGPIIRITDLVGEFAQTHEELNEEWREQGPTQGKFLESEVPRVVLFALEELDPLETAARVHGLLLQWGETGDLFLIDREGANHQLNELASLTIFTGEPPWDRSISIAEARMLQQFLYRLTTPSFRAGLLASACVTGIRPKDSGLLAALKLLTRAWRDYGGRRANDAVNIAATYAHALATVAHAAEKTPVPGYEDYPSIDLLCRLMKIDSGPGEITFRDLNIDYAAAPFNMNP